MGESFLPSLIFFRSEANVGVLLGQQHQPRNPENVLGLATLDEEQREFFPPLIHELACYPISGSVARSDSYSWRSDFGPFRASAGGATLAR